MNKWYIQYTNVNATFSGKVEVVEAATMMAALDKFFAKYPLCEFVAEACFIDKRSQMREKAKVNNGKQ